MSPALVLLLGVAPPLPVVALLPQVQLGNAFGFHEKKASVTFTRVSGRVLALVPTGQGWACDRVTTAGR